MRTLSRAGRSSLWEIPIFKAVVLSEVLKSPPRSQAPGTWLWILEVIPTRVYQEMGHPFTHQFHSQPCPAGAQWSQENIHYCIKRWVAQAEKARADYQLAFDQSLRLHVGIYEFHWFSYILHLLIPLPLIHPLEWTADLSLKLDMSSLLCGQERWSIPWGAHVWLLGRCY